MKKFFWGFIIIVFAWMVVWAQEPIEEEDIEESTPIGRVLLPLTPVESPFPGPTVIQPETPKEKPEDRIGKELPGLAPVTSPEVVPEPQREVQEFPGLAPVAPPGVISQPERQIQQFPSLSPVASPEGIVEPQRQTQQFPALSPVSPPKQIGKAQRQIQQFPTLSPVSPPQDVVEPQGVTQQFPVLSPVTAPAFKDQVGSTPRRFQGLSPITAPTSHNPSNPGQLAYARQTFSNLSPVGTPSSVYRTFRLSDFSGGLNKTGFPTEIADNEVTELVNFVWEGKKLRPRDGFTTYYDQPEFAIGYRIYGLYRYYKRDGRKMLLAGAATHLYADTNSTGISIFVKHGLQQNKNYYFDTFKDKCIVAHEGDYPFWYDGDSVNYIGLADSGKGGLVVRDDIDVDTCLSFILTGDTKLTIEPRPHRPDEKARRRRTEGAPTQYDRYNVKFYETDRWVGYTLEFVDTSGSSYWYYITANIEDTIYLEGQACDVTQWTGNYYIYSYFDHEEIVASTVVGDPQGHYCREVLGLSDSLDIASLADSGIVARIITGFSAGQEHFIDTAWAGGPIWETYIRIARKFDSLYVANDQCSILRKRFWKPSLVKVFKNRVFFAGIGNYPNLVVFSAYNRIGDFPPDNYFLVKTQDGDHITALATFYDDQLGYKDQSKDCLVIFKQNSIYKLVWNSSTDYALVQVVEGIGCVASRSVVNVEGKYLLFLHTSGIYAFDGRTVTPVSQGIEPLLADSINQNKINLASAGYCDRHYYLSYPAGTSIENNRGIVFNIDLGSWGETDNLVGGLFAQQNAISDTVKLLFADPRAKSFIYQFGKVETDTGQPISLTLKSKAFNLSDLHKRKRFTYFDIDYYLNSDSVGAWFYTDFGDSLRYSTYFSESGGNRHARIPLDADCLGRNFSFKLTSNKWFELGSVAFKFRQIGE